MEYDPLNTMIALNMAVVSVNRIIGAKDRTVLEWEYQSIIDRLAVGNIAADSEIISLFRELMSFITRSKLREEYAKRLHEGCTRREKEAWYRAVSNTAANVNVNFHGGLWELLGLAASALKAGISGYYAYQASKEEIRRELGGDIWQLTKQEIEDCNFLQSRLLSSTWQLLDKYKLPNSYRLRQSDVQEFFSIIEDSSPSNMLSRLKFIERKFRVYPPYWFFRENAAMNTGNSSECRKCFEMFNEVWRPVLDYDPYKLETTKYEICEIARGDVLSADKAEKIRELVDVLRDYTPPKDWSSNLFAGIVYFALGDSDEGINCVEYNIASGYENELSGMILDRMKKGSLTVPGIREAIDSPKSAKFEEVRKLAEDGNWYAMLMLGYMYEHGYGTEQNYRLADECYERAKRYVRTKINMRGSVVAVDVIRGECRKMSILCYVEAIRAERKGEKDNAKDLYLASTNMFFIATGEIFDFADAALKSLGMTEAELQDIYKKLPAMKAKSEAEFVEKMRKAEREVWVKPVKDAFVEGAKTVFPILGIFD